MSEFNKVAARITTLDIEGDYWQKIQGCID